MAPNVLSFTALALGALATIRAQELTAPNAVFDYNGASGSFKAYGKDANGTRSASFWNINWRKLYEVDAGGNPIPSRAINNLDLVLTTGSDANGSWVRGVQNIMGPDAAAVTLDILNKLFTVDTQVPGPAPNVTIPVAVNTLKISVNASGWIFSDPGHRLALDVKISRSGGGEEPPSKKGGGNKHEYAMDTDVAGVSLQLSMEDHAFVDGGGEAVSTPLVESGNIVSILLPYHASSVWYDPQLRAMVSGAGAAAAMSTAALFITALAALFTLLA